MSRKKGDAYEELASEYLKQMGFRIMEKNFSTKFGEIDLVCIDDDALVFVEVKYRESDKYGRAVEFVTPSKLRKIKKAAWGYIKKNACHLPDNYRIDVVAIDGEEVSYFRNVAVD